VAGDLLTKLCQLPAASPAPVRSAAMATLFMVPGSHPSLAAALMLEYKGIDYRRVDFAPAVHRVALRFVGFRGRTVPALRIDGRRLQGSRVISRALDELRPEPPLFPSDAGRRVAVEGAEAWGDEVLQPLARRLAWAALKRDHSTIGRFLEGARLGIPPGVAARTAAPLVTLSARLNEATDEAARADLEALPGHLGKVDGLIADGVLGGSERNAADFQIGTSLRLLTTLSDLRPFIEDRPAGRLAEEVVPDFPGYVNPVFPADWLAPLREPAAA
jgi:glutathione S-transferase